MSVIDLAAGKVVKNLQVAPPLSHPKSIAVDPKAPLAFVANANQDTDHCDRHQSFRWSRTLSVERSQGVGSLTHVRQLSLPTAATCSRPTPGRTRSRSSLSPERSAAGRRQALGQEEGVARNASPLPEVAAKHKGKGKKKSGGRKARPFQLVGRIPTGSYPTTAVATPEARASSSGSPPAVSASVRNPGGPNPSTGDDTYLNQYLPSIVTAPPGSSSYPSDRKIRKLTPIR